MEMCKWRFLDTQKCGKIHICLHGNVNVKTSRRTKCGEISHQSMRMCVGKFLEIQNICDSLVWYMENCYWTYILHKGNNLCFCNSVFIQFKTKFPPLERSPWKMSDVPTMVMVGLMTADTDCRKLDFFSCSISLCLSETRKGLRSRARICKRLSSPGIDSAMQSMYSQAGQYVKLGCRTGSAVAQCAD